MTKVDSSILNYHLFDVANTSITVATLIIFAVILLVAFVISLLAQRAAVRAMRFRRVKSEGTEGVVRRLLHYTIMAVGLTIALQTVGIDLSALFAAGAVFAIGLGFAMQNIMQNFVAGLILLVERAIKPGDVLQVEGRFVRVREMSIRTTIARTLDDEEIIMPNSLLVQSTVTNYTLRDSFYRLRATVGVIYGSDMKLVREILERVGASLEWRSGEHDPVILLSEFGSSSVDWEISVWIDEPWTVRRRKSQLNEAIWNAFKEAGITIAFPQLDVHFDPPVVDSIAGLRRAV